MRALVRDAVGLERFGSALYTLTSTGTVRRSTDDGATWSAIGTLSQVGMVALRASSTELYAITREGHLAASVDGAGWTWRGSINQLDVVALGTDVPATGVVVGPAARGSFTLSAPRPNPQVSGRESTFEVTLDSPRTVRLVLYDVRGAVVARRAAEFLAAGTHSIRWSPGFRASGIYAVRAVTEVGESEATTWALVR